MLDYSRWFCAGKSAINSAGLKLAVFRAPDLFCPEGIIEETEDYSNIHSLGSFHAVHETFVFPSKKTGMHHTDEKNNADKGTGIMTISFLAITPNVFPKT